MHYETLLANIIYDAEGDVVTGRRRVNLYKMFTCMLCIILLVVQSHRKATHTIQILTLFCDLRRLKDLEKESAIKCGWYVEWLFVIVWRWGGRILLFISLQINKLIGFYDGSLKAPGSNWFEQIFNFYFVT